MHNVQSQCKNKEKNLKCHVFKLVLFFNIANKCTLRDVCMCFTNQTYLTEQKCPETFI